MNNKPIGIFDSGIGGLTVAHAIWEKLPNESFIYLGDTARVPYGTRGKEVIGRFSVQLAQYLLKREIKVLVVACNTISSTCIDIIRSLTPIPVIEAIGPVVGKAVKTTKNKVIGVIGTRATISSGVYEQKIKSLDEKMKVLTATCPLFVPIAEEGLSNHPVADLMAKHYLEPLSKTKLDTLILGCTHYPLLRRAIQKTVNSDVIILDSASPIADETEIILKKAGLLNDDPRPRYDFLVTDAPERVEETARRFFGGRLPGKIEKITLG